MTAPAIRIHNLSKRYGSLEAVRGISFEVGQGEIFGLIGPDGAGKTSTFQILAGVMEATGGVAEVASGLRPICFIARTGEFTPPGITCCARSYSSSERLSCAQPPSVRIRR